MLLSAYLSPSRHGIYYFRWSLPVGDDRKRQSIRLSLRTRCPNHAGDLARHLASCGKLIKGNKSLAQLTRDQLRTKVKAYFEGQLEYYLDRLNYKDPKPETVTDIEAELLGRQSQHDLWLKIEDFKAKAEISDADWAESQPLATNNELRRGRRDLLRAVLEAVERIDAPVMGKRETAKIADAPSVRQNSGPRKTLQSAIDDFMAKHAHLWDEKYTEQIWAFMNVLLEHFGEEKQMSSFTFQDASEMKKVVMQIPSNWRANLN